MSVAQGIPQIPTQIVTFFLEDSLCGIDVSLVQEVTRSTDVTPVPLAPFYVAGILNLRGHLITVMHLAAKMNIGHTPTQIQGPCIIVKHGQELLGLLVDELREVLPVHPDHVQAPPSSLREKHGSDFSHVLRTDREIIGILHPDEVFKV